MGRRYYLATDHDGDTWYFRGKPDSKYFKAGGTFEFDPELFTRDTERFPATKFTDSEVMYRISYIRDYCWQIIKA